MDIETIIVLGIVGGMLYYLWQIQSDLWQPGGGVPTTGQPPRSAGGLLTASDIAQFAASAGFTGNDLRTAVAIALAESGGNPNAYGDLGQYCCSYGLWQINSFYHPEFGPDFSVLYDPSANASAAYSVYARAGNSFSPWTTYSTGKYLTYLSAVQTAVG